MAVSAQGRPLSMLRAFFSSAESGGLVLMAAAAVALLVANSPLASGYFNALGTYLGSLSVLHWINDALMAMFFLLMGVEIKREVLDGQLSFGAETRIFNPSDLPFPDQVQGDDHPAVEELRAHSMWSEGQVWCSPERHGQVTGLMKAQIDHLPLAMRGMRPTQGRTLAVMQVSGGSQSFNAVNTLRLLGRWMRMVTIPNQSSVAKAWQEFDEQGRMRPSPYYDRIVDVMEELVRFTLLVRPHLDMLTDRYSERKEAGRIVDPSQDLASIAVTPQQGPNER